MTKSSTGKMSKIWCDNLKCSGAFFDMYIGDVPICAETKDEIGRNVATILGHC